MIHCCSHVVSGQVVSVTAWYSGAQIYGAPSKNSKPRCLRVCMRPCRESLGGLLTLVAFLKLAVDHVRQTILHTCRSLSCDGTSLVHFAQSFEPMVAG